VVVSGWSCRIPDEAAGTNLAQNAAIRGRLGRFR
jgi:hypothetical protein